MKQQVRIIGGQYRGKLLTFPDLAELRPTPQRVRETLFNWLMHDIRGARVCDAFAGSGALGFEAFSRGAKQVVLIEKSNLALAHLQRLQQSFRAREIEVRRTDALDYFATTAAQFDIIFLDPPFDSDLYHQIIPLLAQRDVLAPTGLLYVESKTPIPLDSTHWDLKKQKTAGQVCYALYQKIDSNLMVST